MRDLTRERPAVSNDNGHTEPLRIVLPGEASGGEEPLVVSEPHPVVERLVVRRDKFLASMAIMMVDTAKLLDPITRIAVARILTIGAMLGAGGLAVYATALASSWERVAIVTGFFVLCGAVIRRGQPKAPQEPTR